MLGVDGVAEKTKTPKPLNSVAFYILYNNTINI